MTNSYFFGGIDGVHCKSNLNPNPDQQKPQATHAHEQFNLNLIQFRDLQAWTLKHWNLEPHQANWIHASFDCTTQSLAPASTGKHRGAGGTPRGWEAHLSDQTIHQTLLILNQIKTRSPHILITIEQPKHSVFAITPQSGK